MKLTSSQLKQIIKEEIATVLEEEELEEEKRKFLANPKANEKAKEIYKACFLDSDQHKKDQAVCARTAKRQGPPGAQKQGPPYEDTLARPLKPQ